MLLRVRILLVSQFWPGPGAPDLGVFVKGVSDGLERRGHVVARAAVGERGAGRAGDARLARDALRLAVRFKPDVVYAHFLAPAGAIAAAASVAARAPLVVTAHGQDVANVASVPGMRAVTRLATGRASAVIAVSAYLRERLAAGIPSAAAKTTVADCGVDLERFAPRDQAAARAALGLDGLGDGPVVLFVGGLIERKNVVTLADAVAALPGVTLLVVGDGPLRGALEGRARVRLAGARPNAEVPEWIAAADVLALPSRPEPFGQVLLEAMACERSVVATRIGGPPEFVTPQAGVLVDPGDAADVRDGLRRALALPSPNPAARAAAAEHDVRRQVDRIERVLRDAAGAG